MNTEPSLWIITSDRADDKLGSKAGFDTGASYRGIEPPSGRNRHQVSAQTLQQNNDDHLLPS